MKRRSWLLLFVVGLFLIFAGSLWSEELKKLPGYGADMRQTSISGLSSGGFMTAQFHTAYSDMLIGAGIVAAGPFYCAGYNGGDFLANATNRCMSPLTSSQVPDGRKLFAKAGEFAGQGKIADVNHLQDQKVYIFSGSNDRTVKTIVVDQVEKYYKTAGIPPAGIKYVRNNAGHALIVEDAKTPCPETAPPFINDCDYEQSHDILRHIYGELNPPAKMDSPDGKIVKFDQSEFIEGEKSSMSKEAFVFVPRTCESQKCRIHVAMHGCEQGAAVIGDLYYTTTGYNEIAAANNIIVLYPQAEPSNTIPFNPKGCWDFWGYSDADPDNPVFYTREAPQMKAIASMVKRLTEPRTVNK